MNTKPISAFTSFLFFLSCITIGAQGTLKGIVTDVAEYPIENAKITVGTTTVQTDQFGRFQILYESEDQLIQFSAENYLPFEEAIQKLNKRNLEIVLYADYEKGMLSPVITFSKQDDDLSSVQISGEKTTVLPSISGGVQDVLKTLPSVNSNSELSSQYMVRGGNYDENLTYINNIEIYRPQLIRNAQQEGYSILNPNMVQFLNFSPGGFEASYGDRMSSALDIYYKTPKKNYLEIEASLINAELTAGLSDKKNKFSALIGGRFRDTNLILNTLDGDTDFNPRYYDVQSFLSYKVNSKFKIQFLGTYANNHFQMEPKTRETTFGTLFQPIKLSVLYNGNENDRYITENASLQFIFQPRKKWLFQLSPFYYHSTEEEYFDIAAGYLLQELDPATGNPVAGYDAGGQINHARNDLDVAVSGVQFRTDYNWTQNWKLIFGMKYQREDIQDFQTEWQLIDSVGYSIPRNPYEIGDLDDTELQLDYYITTRLNNKTNRFNGFLQFEERFFWGSNKVLLNAGVRGTYWDFNQEFNFSPRFQFTIRPDWNRDMNFKLFTGLYYQPPFYKEMRRLDGTLNTNIKAQQSFQIVFGNDYFLNIWKRPFKLTTEVYFKDIKNLIPYYINNVRVRYTGENNATGKVYGIESRLNGEFVPGVESWFSVAYARAKQDINHQGMIPLPTDPRFKASLFFQDEMRIWPSMKAAINLIYASGLPNGAPFFTNPYEYQSTLPAYKRVDLSLIKVFKDMDKFDKKSGFFSHFENFSLSLDIFNIFNISNTISNQWIRDINSGVSYAVPNRLTGRFFNLRLNMKF